MDRLKTISTFVQIAKSGSLARAAKELGMSRSLVSSHLRQLERHLGVLLVKRTTRTLVLTEAGTEYLQSCLELMKGLVEAEGRLSNLQKKDVGHLKIIASTAFGTLRLGPIIVDFTKKYKKIRVTLILSDRGFTPADFLEGNFDLGLSTDQPEKGAVIRAKIGEVRWIPCVGSGYFETHPPIETPSDLQTHNCLVHRSYSSDFTWRFSGPNGEAEVKVSGSLFTNSAMVLKGAVLARSGVAMLPLYGVGSELKIGEIQQVLPNYKAKSRPLYLVYQDSRYLPHRARTFIDYLKRELKRQPL
jgi:DNA-binding transcriptional LysR family regulator